MARGLPKTRLIGRTGELGRLLAILDDAAQGRAGTALVSGDAGVGKTRLVRELAELARRRGGTVLAGRCAELGDTLPYLPLADALREATRDDDHREAILAALQARPALRRLLPDVTTESGDYGGGGELAQQQLFGAVLGLLAELAEAHPVVLVFEDLHWADRSTRDLLTFLSRVLRHERVCLIATYRSDDLHRRHPLRPVVAELSRLPSVDTVELGPLTAADIAEYVVALTPDGLPAETVEQIVRRAAGNAFYAEELLSATATCPDLPPSLVGLLLGRIVRLSEPTQQLLRAAAVAGHRVDDGLLREVARLPAVEAEAALREAVAHQVLVADGDGYAFRHALLREAVYADLLPGERTRLHEAFATLLADPSRGPRWSAAELAYHCLASHDIPGALTAAVRAGGEAERLAAPGEAHRHYEQALSLWDRVDDAERVAGASRVRVALRAASAAANTGNVARAATLAREVADALPADTGPETIAEVNERLSYWLTDVDEDNESVVRAQTAVAALPTQPPTPLRARALATSARALLGQPSSQLTHQRVTQALTAARAAGAADVEADALVTLGLLTERAGSGQQAGETLASASTIAATAGDLAVELRAAYHWARALHDRGQLAAAAAAADEGARVAERHGLGWSPYGLDIRHLQYLIYYTTGDWDRADELSASFPMRVTTAGEALLCALALFVEVGRGHPTAQTRLVWLDRWWAVDRFIDLTGRGPAAELALWAGDPGGALAHVQAGLAAVHGSFVYPAVRLAATGLWGWADRAVSARASGDLDAASAAVTEAERLVVVAQRAADHREDGCTRMIGVEGRAWLARAEAELARARGRESVGAWQAAVDTFGYGFTYEQARSRWRFAEALAEAGDREAASAQWRQATGVASQLGAVPLRAALDDLARRARFDRSAADEGSGGLAGLTSREREVLRLVAAGRSNREIGAALFIAPKTASVHVSNILTKLGAGSRTEAARIAHREGLVEIGHRRQPA